MLIPISLLHKTTKKVRGFPGFSEKSRTFLFSFHPPVSHTAPSKQPFTYHIPPYCTKIIVEIRYDKIDLPLRVHPAILKCFRDISQHNTFLFALGGDPPSYSASVPSCRQRPAPETLLSPAMPPRPIPAVKYQES